MEYAFLALAIGMVAWIVWWLRASSSPDDSASATPPPPAPVPSPDTPAPAAVRRSVEAPDAEAPLPHPNSPSDEERMEQLIAAGDAHFTELLFRLPRVPEIKRWDLDQPTQTFTMRRPDGSLRLSARGVILGNYSQVGGTWRWSFQNPTVVPTAESLALRDEVDALALPKLQQTVMPCDLQVGKALFGLGAKLVQAEACYWVPTSDHGGGTGIALFDRVDHEPPASAPAWASGLTILSSFPAVTEDMARGIRHAYATTGQTDIVSLFSVLRGADGPVVRPIDPATDRLPSEVLLALTAASFVPRARLGDVCSGLAEHVVERATSNGPLHWEGVGTFTGSSLETLRFVPDAWAHASPDAQPQEP